VKQTGCKPAVKERERTPPVRTQCRLYIHKLRRAVMSDDDDDDDKSDASDAETLHAHRDIALILSPIIARP